MWLRVSLVEERCSCAGWSCFAIKSASETDFVLISDNCNESGKNTNIQQDDRNQETPI